MAKSNANNPIAGAAIIGQSGGPTMVINQSLVGAVLEARKHKQITRVWGACHGIKGVLGNQYIDLSAESAKTLEAVARTPAAALGSVRKKPTAEECVEIFRAMRKLGVRYFFYIGGNDSAETAEIICRMAHSENFPIHVFHIPKTIDNDLRVTDHCPGYGSAARFVAQAFIGDDLDNRSLPGVKINVVMGRHAGFLTAASALGRTRPDSGPHLIYLPERAFSVEKFTADVKACMDRLGRCVVAVSEGIQDDKGVAIASKLLSGVDSHGNIQLSGSGALGDMLAEELKKAFGEKLRVRADTLGYMQRSFMGEVSAVDAREAREVGRFAVRLAAGGVASGSVSIIRAKGPKYAVKLVRTPLEKVARVTQHMAPAFINAAGNNVTEKFLKYARPLAGKLPAPGFLAGKRVSPRA